MMQDRAQKELGFFSSNFVYFPLPKNAVGSAYDKKLPIGILSFRSTANVPYGLYARLALIALTNLAFRNETESISEFTVYGLLKEILYAKPSGIQLEKFAKQLENWAATLISIRYYQEDRLSIQNLLLAEAAEFKLEKDLPQNTRVYLRLTKTGKEFLLNTSFPLPIEAIQYAKSAFTFDCLTWLVSVTYQVWKKDEYERLVEWECLANQFNVTPNNVNRFKDRLCRAIFDIKINIYPQANIRRTEAGLIIKSSLPLTSEKSKHILMVPNFGE